MTAGSDVRARAVRSWAAVHATGPGLALLALTAVGSVLLASTHLTSLGPLRFVSPLSALLILPGLAGTAVGLACTNQVGLPLPDPLRAKAARVAWLPVWVLAAGGAANLGQLVGATADGAAVSRNVAVHCSLAVLAVLVGRPALAWLPSMLLTLVAILFGGDGDGPYRWAILLHTESSTAELGLVGMVSCGVVAAYGASGGGRCGRSDRAGSA